MAGSPQKCPSATLAPLYPTSSCPSWTTGRVNGLGSREEKLRAEYTGHISPISAPSVALEPPHLLWPQALLHPLVLNAGDLVEQAVAAELKALVELAVRQPLPGEEREAGLRPRGLGDTQGPAWGSPTHGYGWDCRGRTEVSWCCSGQGAIPATLSSWE